MPDTTGGETEHRRRPCTACPWRTDTDLTLFSRDDMVKLARADQGRDQLGSPLMGCHLDQPGTAHPLRLCAGWLAAVGPEHLGVRMQVICERLPVGVLEPGRDWPELFESLEQLLAARNVHLARKKESDRA